jgi:hypothetical protein
LVTLQASADCKTLALKLSPLPCLNYWLEWNSVEKIPAFLMWTLKIFLWPTAFFLGMRSDGVTVYLLYDVAEPVVFGAVMGHIRPRKPKLKYEDNSNKTGNVRIT